MKDLKCDTLPCYECTLHESEYSQKNRIIEYEAERDLWNDFYDGLSKNPDDLNADGAMDLLERSAKFDSFITGADMKDRSVQGELAITFADSFKDL